MHTLPNATFSYPTLYYFGAGRRRELVEHCKSLRMHKPLVVTDGGVARLDFFAELMATLQAGLPGASVFSDVSTNPQDRDVIAGVQAYRQGDHDGIILLGGGSPLDAGKCIALMVEHEGSVFDYEDIGDNYKKIDGSKIPPMLAIPTTAGTGSEVGRAGVLVDPSDHARKKIIFHPRLLPQAVIADPELTVALPPSLTAATGVDALVHCLEAYCAPGFHPLADGIAKEGMTLIHRSLETAYRQGDDLVARGEMLVASSMGAIAFQKGLGIVHALAHAIGGHFGCHHGLTNAVLLPYCLLYNRPAVEAKLSQLARQLSLPSIGFEGFLEWIFVLRARLDIPSNLKGLPGYQSGSEDQLARLALQDAALAGNPRPAGLDELRLILETAYEGHIQESRLSKSGNPTPRS